MKHRLFDVPEFFIVFIPVQDMSYRYSFRLFVNSIKNSIFPLVNSVAFEFSIVEIFQLFEVLRGRVPAQRENFNKNLFEEFSVSSAEVLQF